MYESAQRTLNAAAEAAFLAGLCHCYVIIDLCSIVAGSSDTSQESICP